jgi:long-subunit acyl-CoA synthetase (AMP-forming)/N-acetylglutamate synthase-like GNAT family acetyltransferase
MENDLVDRLSSITSVPPGDAAADVGRILSAAAAPKPGDRNSLEVDEAVLASLRSSPDPDPVLGLLDLDQLAGLADRFVHRLDESGPSPPEPLRRSAWHVLDLIYRPSVLTRTADDRRDAWSTRTLELVEKSHLTVGELFRARVERYGSKTLFEVPSPGGDRSYTWRQVGARVETLARGLLALTKDDGDAPVAMLMENRIETALIDLACLTSGIQNVPIQANATEAHVGYILNHCKAGTIIVSSREQAAKVLSNRESAPHLKRMVAIDPQVADGKEILSLDQVIGLAGRVPAEELERRSLSLRIDDPISVMYTSGTTGTPKGIQFSQRNAVFKRFARALALPEIGDRDVFLSYLPLFHTFGRYLEMLGCVFWGATYCFLLDPSAESLVRGMRRHRPTVFISVPMKWIQLYEAIAREADPNKAADDEVREAVHRITGGRLRWGLSAAGHLDSDIFRFFQYYGVELMSGFGMTEATGGITMTPPGRYKDGSLGVPLPGIEVNRDDDGELLVRGPYVMIGYLDPADGEPSFDENGWFHTGDLMEVDSEGYLRLVDRKKEIYKNIKGETIAPQRVENLFRDFESVGRVFLVGDHKEYNTALVYPNPEYRQLDFATLDRKEAQSHFSSIVVSVNKFLAPFERIVDFAIIDRDLDADRGELTPKGTPRRKTVEENFRDVIRLLYRRTVLRVGGLDVSIPNWLFQSLGLLAQDIESGEDRILLRESGSPLTVQKVDDETARIGSYLYSFRRGILNLGDLLTNPRLWLGNQELVEFASLDLASVARPGRDGGGIRWKGRAVPAVLTEDDLDSLRAAAQRPEKELSDLHRAALALESDDEESATDAVRLFETVLTLEEGSLAEPARTVLGRAFASASIEIRRRVFQVLALTERDSRFPATLERFLGSPGLLLDEETRALLCERNLSDAKLEALVRATEDACWTGDRTQQDERRAASLLRLLAEYGTSHPTRYRRLRVFLVQAMLFSPHDSARSEAARAAMAMQEGFRQWLGPAQRIAVDPETGHEYRWADVVTFDEAVPEQDRERLLAAIRNTGFLREAVFLFSGGTTVRLSDIPPGGVWVRLLGSRHGKSVYRITVQTRHQDSFDVAANVNHSLPRTEVEEEIQWLILCGESADREPLVEDFGGYWEGQDLWSEEFIPGETLDRGLKRLSRRGKEVERFRQSWPFFAWSALSAYVDFWNRTGRRWEISEPNTRSVIVPTHDYLTGARLVSISSRQPSSGVLPMLLSLRSALLDAVEERYPVLIGAAGWDLVFSSLLEVVGEVEGIRLLRETIDSAPEEVRAALEPYVKSVEERGFLPMRLFFAAKRYRRWASLNVEPTLEARARTMREFYETYGLQKLGQAHPEARVRFFRETVLREAPDALAEGLEEIIARLRRGELIGDEVVDAIADLRARLVPVDDDDYFLARLSFPHLRPEDAAGFVQTDLGGRHQSEMVVTLEDQEGNPFRIRHALSPKEVGRLHRLFLEANLDVRFRPEHQYLVAINDRTQIIGGIYYEPEEEAKSAHLEKIVVAERFRQMGVASGLMNEFFNRLRAAGMKTVTTGFFRPEYFYAYGFAIEKRYAGLVKPLEEDSR